MEFPRMNKSDVEAPEADATWNPVAHPTLAPAAPLILSLLKLNPLIQETQLSPISGEYSGLDT
jgi:hypothetical protein